MRNKRGRALILLGLLFLLAALGLTSYNLYKGYRAAVVSRQTMAFLEQTITPKEPVMHLPRMETPALQKEEAGRFHYPAYIAIDGYWDSYEYALLSGERQITYIYSSFNYKDDLKKIEEKYLPDHFDSKQETFEFGKGYSIYIEHKSDTEISYDYTRDSVVKVWKHHPITIGYNWFSVDTCLDEQDREIIQTCSYMYYENEEDAMYGLPKEITYTELEGCEYRSVSLNAENTKAIVTYFDGKEEKRMEYEIPKME